MGLPHCGVGVEQGEGDAVYVRACAAISQAFALPEAGREAFLAQAAGDDARLRDEIERLLAALRTGAASFLDRSAIGPLDDDTALRVAAANEYRILHAIGQGGMGQVYLAERRSGDVCDRVALKLLNPLLLGDAHLRQRFVDERRLLARLEHPNIARLLDAGALADGQPFLAMEYVEGVSIERFCRDLPLAEVLRLFLRLCAALAHAHGQLIIHRDIKPGNVLVTAAGEPKLLDFGIARLIDAGEATQTAANARLMTLGYASPEQMAGAPLGVATDVYSLGVLLYELVAGRGPFAGESATRLVARSVAGDVVAPSVAARDDDRATSTRRRWTPAWRRSGRRLPSDLDAIVLKAIRREPGERYASVADFARDIEALLAQRPVRARQGRAWYRTRKFVLRHRYALASALVVVVLLGGAFVERGRQLRAAERAQRQESQVSDLMVDTLGSMDPENAARRSPRTERVLHDLTTRLVDARWDDPVREVRLLQSVAALQRRWGRYADTQAILERAWDVAARDPARVDAATRATIAHDLGDVIRNDAAATERWFRRSLAVARDEIGPDSLEAATVQLDLAGHLLGKASGRDDEIRDGAHDVQRIVALHAATLPDGGVQMSFLAARHLWNLDGDDARFLASIDAALAEAERRDLPFTRRVRLLSSHADALDGTGRHADALREASEVARRASEELGALHPYTQSAQLQVLYFAIEAGDRDAALRQVPVVRDSIDHGEAMDDVQRIWSDYFLVRALARLPGHFDEARALQARNAERAQHTTDTLTAAEHLLLASSRALVAYQGGAPATARQAMTEGLAQAPPVARADYRRLRGDALLLAAEVALAVGDHPAAATQASEARQLQPARADLADALLAQADGGPAAAARFAAAVTTSASTASGCSEAQWIAAGLPLADAKDLNPAARSVVQRCRSQRAQLAADSMGGPLAASPTAPPSR